MIDVGKPCRNWRGTLINETVFDVGKQDFEGFDIYRDPLTYLFADLMEAYFK